MRKKDTDVIARWLTTIRARPVWRSGGFRGAVQRRETGRHAAIVGRYRPQAGGSAGVGLPRPPAGPIALAGRFIGRLSLPAVDGSWGTERLKHTLLEQPSYPEYPQVVAGACL